MQSNPCKNSSGLLSPHRNRTNNLRIHMEAEKIETKNNIEGKKKKAGSIMLLNFKLYFKDIVIKIE